MMIIFSDRYNSQVENPEIKISLRFTKSNIDGDASVFKIKNTKSCNKRFFFEAVLNQKRTNRFG